MKHRYSHFSRILLSACTAAALMLAAHGARAQGNPPKDTVRKLDPIKVTTTRVPDTRVNPLQRETLPASASITAQKAAETVNLIDAEDAVKYLPSVFLRKRNNGDTQATMATRTWGVSSSARSLIFADGVPLTALIANNNNIGGPRWGLVTPAEISRIDMMYGPYSAAYPGNSMGAVMEITTRMPDRREGSLSLTQAMQTFDLYGTSKSFGTTQTAANIGDRFGKFSFWASGNYQNSHSQPLSYVTSASFPNGTTGGFAEQNKLGATANVLGASGLLHTGMTNARLKAAYDLTPSIRAAYTFGYWKNDADATVDPYTLKGSAETFANQSGFASGNYNLLQEHASHSLSLRTDRKRDWDFELVGAHYRFGTDRQNTPTSASDTSFGTAGRVAVLDGTAWSSLDAKTAWHKGGFGAKHRLTAGVHQDWYSLKNPTFNTPDWRTGDSLGSVATEGDGKTRTSALWVQDGWSVAPHVKLTLGARVESWHAYDGYNANGATKVTQSNVSESKVSPKAVVAWSVSNWAATFSVGQAYRFPTAAELYQLVTTGTTFTSPDPNLKPDDVLATEFRLERTSSKVRAQLALFQDDVHDAIISQFLPLVAGSPTLYSYVSNVDHVRSRGAELTLGVRDVLAHGLEFTASATVLDARTLALSGRASATAPATSAIGKFLPNIPARRANLVTTYRTGDLALTLAGRYSSKMFTTLDNADVHPNTYQGFSEWFVADTRAQYKIDRRWTASLGVDNLLNRKYFLFHPFPQRTFVGDVKFSF